MENIRDILDRYKANPNHQDLVFILDWLIGSIEDLNDIGEPDWSKDKDEDQLSATKS